MRDDNFACRLKLGQGLDFEEWSPRIEFGGSFARLVEAFVKSLRYP